MSPIARVPDFTSIAASLDAQSARRVVEPPISTAFNGLIALMNAIHRPDHLVTIWNYRTEVMPGQGRVARIQSVTNNRGYQLKYEYLQDAIPNAGNLYLWQFVSRATTINNAVEYCNPLADHCTLSIVWPYADFGMGAGVDFLSGIGMEQIQAHERTLMAYALERVGAVQGIRIYGPESIDEHSAVVSFTLGDAHPHDISTILDAEGIAIRAGHHCAQLVMRHFGISATARASFYLYNTEDDVDRLVEGLGLVAGIFA